jgi:catechol 2,3-dioxygenase-like lactoylglutathione lyase family enzyme
MHITQVRAAAIPVVDQERALDFYIGKLGFEKQLDVPFGGGRWVTVTPPGAGAAIALVAAGAAGRTGVDTGIRLGTTDADADHADLLAHGVDADPRVLHMDPAPPMFTFRDQDGNTLVIVQDA